MPSQIRRTNLSLTAHGRRRAAARGFRRELLACLIDYADRAVSVGAGCVALSASARAIAEARAEAWLAGDDAPSSDHLLRRVLVLGPDGEIVTALIAAGRKGQRYHRGMPHPRRRASRRDSGAGRATARPYRTGKGR